MTPTTPSSFFESAFETMTRRIRGAQSRRAQHLALASLMEMDAHQLDDLGISIGDVIEARQSPRSAGPVLDARRTSRANAWTADAAAAH